MVVDPAPGSRASITLMDEWIQLKGTLRLGCDGPCPAVARGTAAGPFDRPIDQSPTKQRAVVTKFNHKKAACVQVSNPMIGTKRKL